MSDSAPRPRCAECDGRERLRAYEAEPLTTPRGERVIWLCAVCVRKRGAGWRWLWRVRGRTLDERDAA